MFSLLSFLVLFILAWSGPVNSLCLPCQRRYGEKPISSHDYRNHLGLRTVFSPHITSPTAGTEWLVGSLVSVTWDASGVPPDATDRKGKIILGYLDDDDGNEHLHYKNPLAKNFDIRRGRVNFTVPDVESRDDYIVVLFGDSGNRSPKFSISNT
ncbi:hypothetical protein APHAL10511_002287 [Amanita phalloides]|nr:hypothetical protein APHAL10511_002287 [Amanita phalloides]